MAPPANRRSGFSRRAQYGLFFGYVLAVAGVLLAIFLLIISAVDPRGFSALRGLALDATSPATAGGRSVIRFFGGMGESVGAYFNAASKNAAMRQEIEVARQKLIETRATEYENRRLKQLLGVAEESEQRVATARVIGSSFDALYQYATLAAGSGSGVQVGMPVRGPEGLIGRVLDSGRFASRILLVTDGSSNVPVVLVRDGTPAIATGRGDGAMDLKTLEVGENPFRRGDLLVTSGTGGIYPPNIPVGVVVALAGDSAIARPLASPGRLDYAVVLRPYQPPGEEAYAPEGPR
jgi:rod shape-determining protein MreC